MSCGLILSSESNGLDGQKVEGICFGLVSVGVTKHCPKYLGVEKDLLHLTCCDHILSAKEGKAED